MSMRIQVLVTLSIMASLPAIASPGHPEPDQFAQRFPLEVVPRGGLFAVDLTPAVYTQLTRDDRDDLVVVDALGRAQPAQWLAPGPTADEPVEATGAVRLVIVHGKAVDAATVRLRISQETEATTDRIDVHVASTQGSTTPNAEPVQWWIDAGESTHYDRIRLAPSTGQADFQHSVDIETSADLQDWSVLRRAESILSMGGRDGRLERLEIPLGDSAKRYLRLSSSSGGALPAIERVTLLHDAPKPSGPLRRTLALSASSSESGGWVYRLPGPIPVLDWQLQSSQAFSGRAELSVRDPSRPGDGWRVASSGLQFQLPKAAADWLRADPLGIHGWSGTDMRIHLDGLAAAPTLVVGYRPDRLLVLAQGAGPYALLAGSQHWQLPAAHLVDALDAVIQTEGKGFLPPLAVLGPPSVLAGERARRASPFSETGTLVLWGILVLGAALVIAAGWRVVRSPRAG